MDVMILGLLTLGGYAGIALGGMALIARVFRSHDHTCDAPGPVVPCELTAGHDGRHAAHTGRLVEEWDGVTA